MPKTAAPRTAVFKLFTKNLMGGVQTPQRGAGPLVTRVTVSVSISLALSLMTRHCISPAGWSGPEADRPRILMLGSHARELKEIEDKRLKI